MISHATVRGSRWLFTAMMVVLLGAQVLQSAHVHSIHGQAPDCVQCQADSGQAMAVAQWVIILFAILVGAVSFSGSMLAPALSS